MKSLGEHLRVAKKSVDLKRWDPDSTPGCKSKEQALERIARNLKRIDDRQYDLYAERKRSLLVVVQGMDTAGKDGVIRKVISAFNPQGCKAWSFKVPTPEEAAHDFLWRIHRAAPARGEVAIFNRSHYEDVLVVRVHELVPPSEWKRRYAQINEFERYLHDHGTRILKFFLHIGKDEQKERLLARLDDPAKNWKFSEGDLVERTRWDDYQRAFEDLLGRCSSEHAPWFIVPANRKWYRDLAVSEILADTLEHMNPKPPVVDLDVAKLRARLRRA